ncbi:hypothetical protein JCM3774_001296 [Rhodotorula dairenensis]
MKVHSLIDSLIAANALHHGYLREANGGALPPDYDYSPFFSFTILKRPKSGQNTDHSKLQLFSHVDMQALTKANGSAKLLSPSVGGIAVDNADCIDRNISHKVLSIRTSPLGHPIGQAAAAVFRRHPLLRRKVGLIWPLEALSWALHLTAMTARPQGRSVGKQQLTTQSSKPSNCRLDLTLQALSSSMSPARRSDRSTFVLKADQFGHVVLTKQAGRFDLDLNGRDKLEKFIQVTIKLQGCLIQLFSQEHCSFNPLHVWYINLEDDLVGASMID